MSNAWGGKVGGKGERGEGTLEENEQPGRNPPGLQRAEGKKIEDGARQSVSQARSKTPAFAFPLFSLLHHGIVVRTLDLDMALGSARHAMGAVVDFVPLRRATRRPFSL